MATSSKERWAALAIHPDDDVAVALRDLAAGETVAVRQGAGVVSAVAREAIPMGHKMALRAIAAGAPVRKHGQPIGAATADIAPGAHVHVHNMASRRARSPKA
ncbi:MAG TPA: UxaA family hydrolase [Casimicrobiaceae bacterium]|nr:UxaA family hydrolase [Casimicrobiaceae bacterium]